jgi:hypothetical protein
VPSRKRRKRRRRREKKKNKVSFFNLKRRWKKQCKLHHHSVRRFLLECESLYIYIYIYTRASEWMSEWAVQFINREYVLCTKSVCMYTMHTVAMMCIVLGMYICIHYVAIEYRWWCEVERKKGRETGKKREECIVSAAVKNKSCASSLYCALDTYLEQ